EAELMAYTFHPVLLDAAFQMLLFVTLPGESAPGMPAPVPYLPVSVDRIRVLRHPVPRMQAYARLRQADERFVVGDVQVVDPEGNLLAEIEGFRAQSLETSTSLAPERIDKELYELEWHLAQGDDTTEIDTVGADTDRGRSHRA